MKTAAKVDTVDGNDGNGTDGNGEGRPIPVHPAYATNDLQAAAYLLSHGFRMVTMRDDRERNGMRLNGGGTKQFIFEGVPQQVVLDFYAGQDMSHGRALFAAYHDLRRMILSSPR